MKIKSVELKYVLGLKSVVPSSDKPEFVLAGRSNVGKSSFINAFVNRKSYARISSTPGKTRTINYYEVNNDFFLVDLPGYGYAAAGKVEQEKWGRMIRRYLSSSEQIEEVIQLLDIRHAPSAKDHEMYEWIIASTGFEPLIILTKTDKLKRSEIGKNIDMIKKSLGTSPDCQLIPFSAVTKQGLDEVYNVFDKILLATDQNDSD